MQTDRKLQSDKLELAQCHVNKLLCNYFDINGALHATYQLKEEKRNPISHLLKMHKTPTVTVSINVSPATPLVATLRMVLLSRQVL